MLNTEDLKVVAAIVATPRRRIRWKVYGTPFERDETDDEYAARLLQVAREAKRSRT